MRSLFVALLVLTVMALPARAHSAADIITTFAGGGPNNLPANQANINQPTSVAVDTSGNIYIASPAQHRVFKVDTSSPPQVTVFAGNGTPGSGNECTEGSSPAGCDAPTHTALHSPQAVAVDLHGNVFIADTLNNVVRVVNTQSTAITVAGVTVQPGTIATVAGNGGSGFSGDNGAAIDSKLARPFGLALDSAGNIYVADIDNNRVRRVDTAGIITTVAGNSAPGFSGDGGPAVAASLNQPTSVTLDSSGNLYIADSGNHRVRRVIGGVISTYAGNGSSGVGGEDVLATSVGLSGRLGISFGGTAAALYVADTDNGLVRVIDSTQFIHLVAGNQCFGYSLDASCHFNPANGDGTPANTASLNGPIGVGVDASGNVYIADTGNLRVREIVSGIINTVAGNGLTIGGDGALATYATLNSPQGMATDAAGNVFVVDTGESRIRAVNTQPSAISLAGVTIEPGSMATVAGNGCFGYGLRKTDCQSDPSAGDGNPATGASLNGPTGVGLDGSGNIFVADAANQRIRVVNTHSSTIIVAGVTIQPGYIATVAGNGCPGYSLKAAGCTSDPSAGDGVLATNASLYFPSSVVVDGSGNIFIADTDNHRIRKVDGTTGVISTFAGTGMAGFSGDGGSATAAELNFPAGIAFDTHGNLYIADESNQRIRKVDTGGNISTAAGNGTAGFDGDGGGATGAMLNSPTSVAVDSSGNLYIADFGNQAIRRVDTTQTITTVAGNGVFGFSGDNGPANLAMVANPSGVAVDASGNLYIADTFNDRIRQVASPAAPAVSLSPPSISFGDQLIATESQPSSATTVTIFNTGTATLSFASFDFSADFGQGANVCLMPPLSGSVAPGRSCSVQVIFRPSFAGTETGTLTITDQPSGGSQMTQTVSLSGTGTQSSAVLSSTSLLFGDQLIGTSSSAQGLTLQNNGSAPLTVGSVGSNSGEFSVATTPPGNCGGSLAIGATCMISVVFTPTAGKTRNGSLIILESADKGPTGAPIPRIVNLTGNGTGQGISLSQATLSFGFPQEVGSTSAALMLTVTSNGTVPLAISSIVTTGDFSATTDPPGNCGGSLAISASCTVNVTFAPTALGTKTGTLTISDGVYGSPQTLSLMGTGVPPTVALSQTTLTFGNQGVATTSTPLAVALTATGSAPVLISSIATTGDFAETNNCGSSVASAVTCTINVTFTPTANGARSGTLTVTDNASGSPQTVVLSGTGVLAFSLVTDRTSATVLRGTDNAVFNLSASSAYSFSGAVSLSCVGNSPGVCSFSTASVSAGQNSVLTVSNLNGVSASSLSFTVTGTSGSQSASLGLTISIADFAISASSPTATVTAGQTTTYTLKIQPSGGFNQPVALNCTGAPLAATCSVSPVTVTPDGTNPVSATVTVTTTAIGPAMALRRFTWPGKPGAGGPLLYLGLTLAALAGLGGRRGRARYVLAISLVFITLWSACGGGSGQLPILKGTPSGSYTLTVTATSGSLSHNTTLTLNVN